MVLAYREIKVKEQLWRLCFLLLYVDLYCLWTGLTHDGALRFQLERPHTYPPFLIDGEPF